jgi:hypothetical protein
MTIVDTLRLCRTSMSLKILPKPLFGDIFANSVPPKASKKPILSITNDII